MIHIRTSFFYLLVLFSNYVIANDNFYLYINQLKGRSITTENFSPVKSLPVDETVTNFTLHGSSGIDIPVTFYDRKSDVVVVAAQGLTRSRKAMTVFATTIFPQFDVILFDYRWSEGYGAFLRKAALKGRIIKSMILDEEEELKAVLNFVAKRKSYKSIIGLGQCYSCFLLAKIQSNAIKKKEAAQFTHLILDSSWYSLRRFAESYFAEIIKPKNRKVGNMRQVAGWVADNPLFKAIVFGGAFIFASNVSIAPYIATVDVPVLFVHGRNDPVVPKKDFKKIWDAANRDNRVLLSTPYAHANNLGNKPLFKAVCDAFVSSDSTEQFKDKLKLKNSHRLWD